MKNNADMVTLVSRTRTFHTGYRDSFKCEEFLHDGSFRFERGKSYGILCGITEGGGGISWLLAGRDVVREEELDVFGRRYSAGETVEEGWLVCEGIPGVDRTVAQEIGMGLGSSGLGLSVNDVAGKFELSECRMDFKLRHGGWEGWRASAAIGYAMGKQIFCFPWLDTGMMMDVSMCGYFFYTEILKQEGGIVIIPGGSREVLEVMADEIIELDHSWLDREISQFKGRIADYRNKEIRPVTKKGLQWREKEERTVEFFAPDSWGSSVYQNRFKCHEFLYGETFHFERGKSYGILCEVSEGGGALSWILSGRKRVLEEEITVFGRRYSKGERVQEGWFLGEGIRGMDKTVARLIRTALNRNRLGLGRNRREFIRVKDVAEKFSLTKDGLRSRIEDCGWEGWRASAAIGYALGGEIFCFPWLYTQMLMDIVANTGYFSYIEELKRAGGIVIVPASHRGILEEITDEIIEAPGLRLKVDMERFNRYMDEYRNNKG